ncbi:hypothetical protein AGMMS50212_11770 [Spirochaetia bacterium]|nr:hypothetical protein AGMMS50212_11770 [Spirochaetia bacterium]
MFPVKGFAAGTEPSIEDTTAFAEILGIGHDYKIVLKSNSDTDKDALRKYLDHFQNNLTLLISKTWVEKSDEIRKERLQSRIPAFTAKIEKSDYKGALRDFGDILEELAFLFFGKQSHAEDFTEYTLRIDTQMGLFWWYGSQIRRLDFTKYEACLRALLLIGLCYLTDF